MSQYGDWSGLMGEAYPPPIFRGGESGDFLTPMNPSINLNRVIIFHSITKKENHQSPGRGAII